MAWHRNGPKHNYHSREYRLNREVAMRRAEGLCEYCRVIEDRVTAATECDHIVSVAQGGTDDADNLQALCGPCHARKTGWERNGRTGWPPFVDWNTGWSIEDQQDRILAARDNQ